MLQIVLYKNNSEDIKLDKDITQVKSMSGDLKNETSIINPTIRFIGSVEDIADCNYMYISAFKRYYYIRDIKSIRNNIYEITAHVDVLMSYKDQIRNCTGIVARNENDYNLYLDDGVFKCYSNPMIQTFNFPNGFGDFNFILAVAGG